MTERKKRAIKNVMLLAKSHVVTVVVGAYTLMQRVTSSVTVTLRI